MMLLNEISKFVDGHIKINEPLCKMTSYKIGGPADIIIEPNNMSQLFDVIKYLKKSSVEYIVIGNGTNVLVSDEGYRGAIISLSRYFNDIITNDDGTITVGAGIRLSKFVDYMIEKSYKGYEMLAGIPGSLGGAIIINAGAYGGEISDYIVRVAMVGDNNIIEMNRNNCGFGYRTSKIQKEIVLNATFSPEKGNREEMQKKRRFYMVKRNSSQPVKHHNAGSIFKNPPGMYAAKLIEENGLKGIKIGSAEISEQHANFIICKEAGSATDVIALINYVRNCVHKNTGVILEPEIKLIGFANNVILPLS